MGYLIKVALFFPFLAFGATTTQDIVIQDIASTTSRWFLTDMPVNVACTYSLGKSIGPDFNNLTGGTSGSCNTNDFLVGDNSVRVQPNFDNPIETNVDYKGYVRTATSTFIINNFFWNGSVWNGARNGTTSAQTCIDNPTTRIIDFTPEDNSTTTSPVLFTLDACIDDDDLGTFQGINISLHNIDQNVLLLSDFSPNDIYLLAERDIETPGLFQFATSAVIGDGNYRLEACIQRSYLFGFLINPLAPTSDCQSHQFIVGTSTFIGNISQSLFGDVSDFYDGLTATSSEALANTCNLISGNFSVRHCIAFLFIPDANSLKEVMENAREGFLTRFPWGYMTRFATILTDTATSSLPTFTSTIQMGPGDDLTPETTTITIDPGDMLAGASTLLNDTRDPITNKNAREVFEPFVLLTIGLGVIFTIVTDLMKSHRHVNESESRNGTLS